MNKHPKKQSNTAKRTKNIIGTFAVASPIVVGALASVALAFGILLSSGVLGFTFAFPPLAFAILGVIAGVGALAALLAVAIFVVYPICKAIYGKILEFFKHIHEKGLENRTRNNLNDALDFRIASKNPEKKDINDITSSLNNMTGKKDNLETLKNQSVLLINKEKDVRTERITSEYNLLLTKEDSSISPEHMKDAFKLLKKMTDYGKIYARNKDQKYNSFAQLYIKLLNSMKASILNKQIQILKLRQMDKSNQILSIKDRQLLKQLKQEMKETIQARNEAFGTRYNLNPLASAMMSRLDELDKAISEMDRNQNRLDKKFAEFDEKLQRFNTAFEKKQQSKTDSILKEEDIESACKYRNQLCSMKAKNSMQGEKVDARIKNLGKEIDLYMTSFVEKSKASFKDENLTKDGEKKLKDQIETLHKYGKIHNNVDMFAKLNVEKKRLVEIFKKNNQHRMEIVSELKEKVINQLQKTMLYVDSSIKELKQVKSMKTELTPENKQYRGKMVNEALEKAKEVLSVVATPEVQQVLIDDKNSTKQILGLMLQTSKLVKKEESAVSNGRIVVENEDCKDKVKGLIGKFNIHHEHKGMDVEHENVTTVQDLKKTMEQNANSRPSV